MMMWLTEPIIRNAASFRSGCLSLSGLELVESYEDKYSDKVVLMNCRIPLKEDFCRLPANVIKNLLAAISGVRYSSYTSDVNH